MKMEKAIVHQQQSRTHCNIATCEIGHWVQHQCGAVEVDNQGSPSMVIHKARNHLVTVCTAKALTFISKTKRIFTGN